MTTNPKRIKIKGIKRIKRIKTLTNNEKSVYHVNKKIEELLRKQYFIELENHIFYTLCTCWFQSKNLVGFAHFFKLQAEEEYYHSKKIIDYILERKIKLKAIGCSIKSTLGDLKDPKEFINMSYKREKNNSRNFVKIMKLATVNNDFHLQNFLGWFIDEQLEEERLFENVLKKFELLKNNKDIKDIKNIKNNSYINLYEIDKDLGKRKK